jgi:hypothetical protein
MAMALSDWDQDKDNMVLDFPPFSKLIFAVCFLNVRSAMDFHFQLGGQRLHLISSANGKVVTLLTAVNENIMRYWKEETQRRVIPLTIIRRNIQRGCHATIGIPRRSTGG